MIAVFRPALAPVPVPMVVFIVAHILVLVLVIFHRFEDGGKLVKEHDDDEKTEDQCLDKVQHPHDRLAGGEAALAKVVGA